VLTQAINWHWIFFVNLPIGLVTVILAARLLEPDRGLGLSDGADVPGALLVTSALMLGVYTIVKPAAEDGWAAARTLELSAICVALLIGFVVRESRARSPLVPLRILRSRNLVSANVVQVFSVAGMFGMFFLGALYLRRVLGYDPLQIGLAFLPVTIAMGTLSIRYSERLVTRFGARALLIPGLSLIMAGLIVFARAPVDGSYLTSVMPAMALLGIGAGICFPALMNIAMSGVAARDAGLASGLVNTTAQVGGALGLAVLATLSTSHTNKLIAQGESTRAALTSGYHLAFWVAAALVAVAIAVASLVRETRAVVPEVSDGDPQGAREQETEARAA
jgi:MFS family permease